MARIQYDVKDASPPPPTRPTAWKARPRAPGAPAVLDLKPLGRAGKLVRELLPWTEADPAALLIDLLVSFGSAVGPAPHRYAGGEVHPLKLFSVTVGDTSSGRKGTARAAIRALFELAEPEWSKECVGGGLSSGEGLIAAMSEMKKPKRFMAVETEFGKVLAVASRSGQTISDMVRQLWDGDRVHIMNRTTTRLDGAFFSLLGHITEAELRERMAKVDFRNGFGNRILWVYSERSQLLPQGDRIPDTILLPLARRLRKTIARARELGDVPRTQEAEKVWTDWYRRAGQTRLGGALGDLTNRREGQCVRLQLAFAAFDGKNEIHAEHVEAAAHLLRYCEKSAAHVFGKSTGDAQTDKVITELGLAPSGELKRSQISTEVLSDNVKGGKLDAIRDRLLSDELITVEKQATKGRSAEVWRLRP